MSKVSARTHIQRNSRETLCGRRIVPGEHTGYQEVRRDRIARVAADATCKACRHHAATARMEGV
jgi:hypothetical protein